MKGDLQSNIYREVDIQKLIKGRQPKIKNIQFPLLWPNGHNVSVVKVKDLKELMIFVPKDAKPFYKFLKSVKSIDVADDVEEFGVITEELDEEPE